MKELFYLRVHKQHYKLMLHKMAPLTGFHFDSHYTFLTFLVIVVLNYSAFTIAYFFQVDLLTDLVGSLGFILGTIIPFICNQTYEAHRITLVIAILVTRIELGGFLFFRVLKRGRDSRFDEMRSKPLSFFGFWNFQIIWAYCSCFSTIFTLGDQYSPSSPIFTSIGGSIYGLAFIFQIIADFQKYKFRADYKNNAYPCTIGVWRYSRHPNYFAEIIMFWALFLIAIPTLINTQDQWGWISIISPIVPMILLLFVSGIPYAEGKYLEKYYKNPLSRKTIINYQNNVSPLIPFPPSIYSKISPKIKKIFFLELPIYKYDEKKNDLEE